MSELAGGVSPGRGGISKRGLQRARMTPRHFLSRMDLKTRLSLLIGGLLAVILMLAVWLVLNNSRRAVQHEIDSVMWLAAELIDEWRRSERVGPGAAGPELPGLLDVLDNTRHLCVVIESVPLAKYGDACPEQLGDEVPAWFAARVTAQPRILHRTLIDATGRPTPITIHSDPAAEIVEAWEAVRPLLLSLLVIGFLTNAIVVVTVWRALRPIELIRDALFRIGRGELRPVLPEANTPELQSIIDGVSELGASLELVRSDNRRLLQQSLEVQERERRLVARDLHDEIGQNLAAMDTEAALLLRQPVWDEHPDLRQRMVGIRAGISGLYDALHSLLARLRPAGLDEFGLGTALKNLIGDWAVRCPVIMFESEIDIERIDGDPLIQVHLYRIAQEAITNAVRHAQPSLISVRLVRHGDGGLLMQIRDDGEGIPKDLSTGVKAGERARLGLVGIVERAEILKARLTIDSDPVHGTVITLDWIAAGRLGERLR